MYWLILACVIIGIVVYDNNNKRNGRDFLYYTTLVLVVFTSAFAYRLGTDAQKYQDTFESFVPTIFDIGGTKNARNFGWQPGFFYLLSLCKTIIPSFYFFKFVYASFINFTIFSFFRKNTKHVFLALLFYLLLQGFYFNFEIFKETLAICVFIWAYPYIEKKRWYTYYFLCLLALSFHMSAIITFFIPLVRLIKLGTKQILISLMIAVVIMIILSEVLLTVAGNLLALNEQLEAEYSGYLLDDYYTENRFSLNSPSTWMTLLLDVFLPIVMLYVLPKKGLLKDYYPLMIIAFLLVVPAKSILIIFRFSIYFFVFRALFYIDMFSYLSKCIINKRNFFLPVVIVCFIYVGYFFYKRNFTVTEYGFRGIDLFYPYVTCFSN